MNEITPACVNTLRALSSCTDCFARRNPPSGKSQNAAGNVMACDACAQIVLGWAEEIFRKVWEAQATEANKATSIPPSDSEISSSNSSTYQLRSVPACPGHGGQADVAIFRAFTCNDCALAIIASMSQPAVGTRWVTAQKTKTFDDLLDAAAAFVRSRRDAAPGPDSTRTWEQFFALAAAVKNMVALKNAETEKPA